eukprot:TRINITY_DN3609_c0_g2_i1.p1 TRINITY_DN3609_c0_g2~~TRINITY_DN3609_c0_g2_i1.p1  ORF type:complete len:214 (+),score=56.06 TRINITY_DN3609_c0_g2_i1:50-643(+)
MGITRSSLHKRRVTGGKKSIHQKKRKYELGRVPANTKLVMGNQRVTTVRTRGGNKKHRALRLDTGNFSWGSESCTRKARILDVVFNATSNELIRTKSLVKSAILEIDGSPFRNWYYKRYGVKIAPRDKTIVPSESRKARWASRTSNLEKPLQEQLRRGKVLAKVSSRPGQDGRADGYILEGAELAFYNKKIKSKNRK